MVLLAEKKKEEEKNPSSEELNDWQGTERLPKAVFTSNCQENLKQTFEM